MDGARAHSARCERMPTQKQTEMMMTTGVKSNICIGSFVTRIFKEGREKKKHVIFIQNSRGSSHSSPLIHLFHSFDRPSQRGEEAKNTQLRFHC